MTQKEVINNSKGKQSELPKKAAIKKKMKQLVEKAKGVKVFVDGIEFK